MLARVSARHDRSRGVSMSYADRHPIYDADSHVMELPNWLEQFADSGTRARLRPLYLGAAGAMAEAAVQRAAERSATGPLTLEQLDPHLLLNSKGWDAIGAFDASERSRVLDALGFDAPPRF